MPTLLIVQVGLGYETQDVDATVTVLRAEAQRDESPVLDTVFSNTDTPVGMNCVLPPNISQHRISQINDTEMQQLPEDLDIYLPEDHRRPRRTSN